MSAPTSAKPATSPGFTPGFDQDFAESAPESQQPGMVIALVAGTALLLAVYGNMLSITSEFWADDTYSHGWLIPLIGLFLMWSMRRPNREVTSEMERQNWMIVGVPLVAAIAAYFVDDAITPNINYLTWGFYCIGILAGVWVVFHNHDFEVSETWERWVGLAAFVVALLARIFAARIDMKPADRLTFLLAALGIFAAVGGFSLLKRMAVPLLFFVFMFPLPSAIEEPLLLSLQKFAAMVSTFILQMMGFGASLSGYKIDMVELRDELEVAEACSGMRMMTIFSAMTIAFVLLMKRPWWDKLVMLVSAIPIALATNIIRITVTALLYYAVEGPTKTEFEEQAKIYIHDYAGFAMILIAMGIMFVEYKLLERLSVPDDDDDAVGASLIGQRAVNA